MGGLGVGFCDESYEGCGDVTQRVRGERFGRCAKVFADETSKDGWNDGGNLW